MIIETSAYGRAGLIGNPSDGYFGKTISLILRNFRADVICYESPTLNIDPCQQDQMSFSSMAELRQDVQLNGYYGGLRLIKASIKRFNDYCIVNAIDLPNRNFTLEYRTNIPVRVGLAGSSAIVTATMRALMAFYKVSIEPPHLANLVLSVELAELGIGAGLQDRVVQAYEGLVYMDFNRTLMEQRGYGNYVSLDPALLPPLFVAYHSDLAEGTEVTHNDLRSRFERKDPEVLAAMQRFGELTDLALQALQTGDHQELGLLMDQNYDLRHELIGVSSGNQQLVRIAREHNCHAKLAGSGGAVIGTYDGEAEQLEALRTGYAAIGASLITPEFGSTRI